MELFNLTGFLLHRTDMKMTNYFKKRLKQFEITPEQWGILSVMDGERAITQKELSDAIDRDQTTVVRMIYSLEKKGIVIRTLNDEDRRSHNLLLSDKGMELKSMLIPVVTEAHSHVTQKLTDVEIAELHALLDKLYQVVKDE
ncbi:MarR family transcriptional regulator [Brevibacillus sp. HB1.2]|uniref:MarR family winged helix-turn-helix transcriptional regulator n=1 Tax=Brevibacillus TaxID=55080 RepID=UPI00036B359A|nr:MULTISPECIES: MarR family transcriptional regulator [unclassified Brevibacillus]ATF12141.1 MarR family transcriptional regulator [Brevibacillus brevis X23]NRS16384.1 MarR family transcriptional regulator [Brevibacillus sp. HB1.4B]NTU20426.1 MarR family transcriptional regulator [Brevibacillus sp. HB1.2]